MPKLHVELNKGSKHLTAVRERLAQLQKTAHGFSDYDVTVSVGKSLLVSCPENPEMAGHVHRAVVLFLKGLK